MRKRRKEDIWSRSKEKKRRKDLRGLRISTIIAIPRKCTILTFYSEEEMDLRKKAKQRKDKKFESEDATDNGSSKKKRKNSDGNWIIF